ncbi:MAG: GatB/YqeY domain-containing protein [Patescibacteria group bacterium]|nr:GatB/YqeY domain-containing protein [Patescibacteria group bacterium]
MLLATIKHNITEALKTRDTVRVNTLRFLLSAIRNAGIAKYGAKGEEQMTDHDILDVIRKQVKTRNESIEAFSKAGRTDLVQKEQQERDILLKFLPEELSDEALRIILEPIVKSREKNFGLLMKQAMAAVQGKADGSRVAAMLRSLL